MKMMIKAVSDNTKVGPIPVSTSPRSTCADSCPFKDNGCYGDNFPLSLHWDRLSNGETKYTWEDFIAFVKKMRRNQLWRHNQTGDLPGDGDDIDEDKMLELVDANKGKRGFTFTHKPLTPKNRRLIKYANDNGFVINLSANTLEEADTYYEAGVGPVTVVIPSDSPRDLWTPKGRRISMCPAQHREYMTCAACQMCQHKDRRAIVGFLAHGTKYKTVDRVIAGLQMPKAA